MGEKDCDGHLDWGLVCGYIPVNAQGAHWECRCIPVKAQGDQWDCRCIPVSAQGDRETSGIVGVSLTGPVNAQGAQWDCTDCGDGPGVQRD